MPSLSSKRYYIRRGAERTKKGSTGTQICWFWDIYDKETQQVVETLCSRQQARNHLATRWT
jgi:hypothetical protein